MKNRRVYGREDGGKQKALGFSGGARHGKRLKLCDANVMSCWGSPMMMMLGACDLTRFRSWSQGSVSSLGDGRVAFRWFVFAAADGMLTGPQRVLTGAGGLEDSYLTSDCFPRAEGKYTLGLDYRNHIYCKCALRWFLYCRFKFVGWNYEVLDIRPVFLVGKVG